MTRNGDIWVFAYGSLMWRPDFPYLETAPALLRGYHRSLCLYSVQYRGTREVPGLVLGLDHGGACSGRAYRIAAADSEAVLAYLYEREMGHYAYRPKWLDIAVGARRVSAYTFIIRRDHEQYAGKLDEPTAVALIRQGHGQTGSCVDYLRNTVEHLNELGIRDRRLERLLAKAGG